jgi:hypothetical protein
VGPVGRFKMLLVMIRGEKPAQHRGAAPAETSMMGSADY